MNQQSCAIELYSTLPTSTVCRDYGARFVLSLSPPTAMMVHTLPESESDIDTVFRLAGIVKAPMGNKERLAVAARLLHLRAEIPGALAVAYQLLQSIPRSWHLRRAMHRSAHLRVITQCLVANDPDHSHEEETWKHLDSFPFRWVAPAPSI